MKKEAEELGDNIFCWKEKLQRTAYAVAASYIILSRYIHSPPGSPHGGKLNLAT
jgi:hypothetical protein